MRILLVLVLALGAGACAARSSGVPVPRPFPGAALPPAPTAPPPTAAAPVEPSPAGATTEPVDVRPRTSLVATALQFRGVPYRNGGSDPAGFDCSGLVQYVFAQHGLALPREVRDQYGVGERVGLSEVKAGDLLFFETVTLGASHVGLAIGGDQFVHAPSSRGVVRVERFSASYWARRFVGARRVTEAVTSAGTPAGVRSAK